MQLMVELGRHLAQLELQATHCKLKKVKPRGQPTQVELDEQLVLGLQFCREEES